jgi:hypothetical protein
MGANVSDDDINVYRGDFPESITRHGFGMRGDHDTLLKAQNKPAIDSWDFVVAIGDTELACTHTSKVGVIHSQPTSRAIL